VPIAFGVTVTPPYAVPQVPPVTLYVRAAVPVYKLEPATVSPTAYEVLVLGLAILDCPIA
jgi:hypothetical protein